MNNTQKEKEQRYREYQKKRLDICFKHNIFGCVQNHKKALEEIKEFDKQHPEESKRYKEDLKDFS